MFGHLRTFHAPHDTADFSAIQQSESRFRHDLSRPPVATIYDENCSLSQNPGPRRRQMALGLIERSMKGPSHERVAENSLGADESCGIQPEPVLSRPERPAAHCHPLRILSPGDGYLDIDRSEVRGVTPWPVMRILCGMLPTVAWASCPWVSGPSWPCTVWFYHGRDAHAAFSRTRCACHC